MNTSSAPSIRSSIMFVVFVVFAIASPAMIARTGRPLIRGGRPPWILDSLASLETSVRRACDDLFEDILGLSRDVFKKEIDSTRP